MQVQGETNLPQVKAYSQAFVLDFVRLRGRVTRRMIAEASGLTFQTVSNIIERLLESGLLQEELGAIGGGGRQSRLVQLNEDAAYAVGIQLSRAALSVVVTNLAARVLAHRRIPFSAMEGPEAVLSSVRDRVRGLLAEAEVPMGKVLGVGMGVPGPIDLQAGRLRDVPNFEGWRGFPVKEEMERLLGLSVLIDRNATAAALGERWSGAGKEVDNFVYIYVGSGVGAGIVVGGEAYRGETGNSGDIGHVCVEPNGVRCFCGRIGCLEMYSTPRAVLREARRAMLEMAHLSGDDNVRLPDNLQEVIEGREPAYLQVTERAGSYLGSVISRLVGILDPELVVLGGPAIPLLGQVYKNTVEGMLADELTPSRTVPRVELSTTGELAGSVGAASLVLHDLYAPVPDRLSRGL